ncbi:MAG: SpoIIE family protein phosphatase [Spirochaetales bacterium]|nr:SpoIIE family protein phosphatase [Spirochaetales bacterium]
MMHNDVSQSKHHLESIFDSITEPIFSVNNDYRITRLNKKYESLLQKTFQDILGQLCYTQLYRRSTVCPECPISNIMKEGKKTSFKISVSDERIYDVHCFPLYDKNGAIIEMVEFARDITEEERIRNELVNLQRQVLATSLKLADQNKELERAYTKLSRELTLARIVQRGILPQSLPQPPELRTAVYYYPMEDVGGDLYDFIQINSDLIGIILADVSGHGIPAAFIAAMAKMSFYLHAMNNISTARVLSQVNKDMCTNLHTNEFFFTASYCLVDLITNRVKYSNAGHPHLLIYRNDLKAIESSIKEKGLIMGLNKEALYEEEEIELNKGDRLIFYTDGITECSNGDETFGLERLKDILLATSTYNVKAQVDEVERELRAFMKSKELGDDVTLIIIEAALDNKYRCFDLDNEFDTMTNVSIVAIRHPLEFERAISNTLGVMDTFMFHDQSIRNTKFAMYEALNMYYHSRDRHTEPIYVAFRSDKECCTVVIVDSRYLSTADIFPYYRSNANNHSMNVVLKNIDTIDFKHGGKKIVLKKYNK